jgi:hypothetical protein
MTYHNFNQGDEIEVPVIEICDGWTVDDIETENDCDDAFAVLTALVVSIEARMDDLAIAGKELSVDYKRAKSALRWKKAALSVVGIKRGKIKRQVSAMEEKDRNDRIIRYIAAMHNDVFQEAQRHIFAETDALVIKKGRAA